MTSNTDVNNPDEYQKLTNEEKQILLSWIPNNLGRADRIYKKYSSYDLKHFFEKSPQGFYLTNGQFKGAMLAAEYRVLDKNALNWHFNISKIFIERLKNS